MSLVSGTLNKADFVDSGRRKQYRGLHEMEKLKSGSVITNHSLLVPKLFLYLSKEGNSFINKIKTNNIQGRKRGLLSAI